jgi:hypothetical protein
VTLPLPFSDIKDRPDVQGNFDWIKNRFPLTRRDIALGTITRDRLAPDVDDVPRFRGYRTAALALATNGVVAFDTEEKDSQGWFDTTTGAFTPQRAGTYRFSWAVRANVPITADNFWIAYLAKNAGLTRGGLLAFQRAATALNSVGSANLDANGTTDAFTVVIQHNNGGTVAINVGNSLFTFFDGEWVGA